MRKSYLPSYGTGKALGFLMPTFMPGRLRILVWSGWLMNGRNSSSPQITSPSLILSAIFLSSCTNRECYSCAVQVDEAEHFACQQKLKFAEKSNCR
jgi:hypothetical protein